MKTNMRGCALFAGVTAFAVATVGLLPSAPAQTPVVDNTGIEIQARGPIHEAFAQPSELPLEPGVAVPQQPPPPVPEIPPDLKPDGANVQWFGGYWAWDADRNGFDWISGAYRDVPPGRKYVAGYWEQDQNGWRWVAGFWAPDGQAELPYVPQPPASIDTGPTLPPPGDDYFYNPGTWLYQTSRYVWQPGYYAQCRPGYVWAAPHYVWTPCGYLFVNGYWDYPLEQRGVLFAPVVFNQPLWATPGWAFRPYYTVGFRPLLDSLFVDIRFGHYRFGDYYGTAYVNRGIHPWHSFGGQHYDPLYSYYRWQNRGNPGWQNGLVSTYNNRLAGRQPLPPRTLTQQNLVLKQNNVTNVSNLQVVQPITQINNTRVNNSTIKLNQVSQAVVTQQQSNAKFVQQAAQNRFQHEAALAKGPALAAGKTAPPRTLNLSNLGNVAAGKTAPLPATKGPGAVIPNTKSVAPITANKGIQDGKSLPSISKGQNIAPNNKGIPDAKALPAITKSAPPVIQNKGVLDHKAPTVTQQKGIPDAKALSSIPKSTPIPQNRVGQDVKSLPSINQPKAVGDAKALSTVPKSLPSVAKSPPAAINQNKAIQSAKAVAPAVRSSPPPATINQNKAIQNAKATSAVRSSPPQIKAQAAHTTPAVKTRAPAARAATPPAPRPAVSATRAPARQPAAPAPRAKNSKKK